MIKGWPDVVRWVLLYRQTETEMRKVLRHPFLSGVTWSKSPLSPPSECQRLPRGEYSGGEGQPAGWHPHFHRYDSGQRGRRQDTAAQGRLTLWLSGLSFRNGAAPAGFRDAPRVNKAGMSVCSGGRQDRQYQQSVCGRPVTQRRRRHDEEQLRKHQPAGNTAGVAPLLCWSPASRFQPWLNTQTIKRRRFELGVLCLDKLQKLGSLRLSFLVLCLIRPSGDSFFKCGANVHWDSRIDWFRCCWSDISVTSQHKPKTTTQECKCQSWQFYTNI